MNEIKLLSFQNFSLYQNGGASRVLRRLFKGRENSVISVYVFDRKKVNSDEHIIHEIAIPSHPLYAKWMRSFVRSFSIYLRDKVLLKWNLIRGQKKIENLDFNVTHVIDHGPYPATFILLNKTKIDNNLWVSFHDHYTLTHKNINNTKFLWNAANRRLVISDQLGKEYQFLFGNKNYEVITDGVAKNEISTPTLPSLIETISIYFSGLLHNDYVPLFKVLANALDILSLDFDFKLILRGTHKLDFLENRKFEVEYRSYYSDDDTIKVEMDETDILYLPIKFSNPDFYRFSLSTKMIGYLGACGTILYHGPQESAAAKKLIENNAAFFCFDLDTQNMVATIKKFLYGDNLLFSANAKTLAENDFCLESIRSKFWNI